MDFTLSLTQCKYELIDNIWNIYIPRKELTPNFTGRLKLINNTLNTEMRFYIVSQSEEYSLNEYKDIKLKCHGFPLFWAKKEHADDDYCYAVHLI